MKIVFMGTPYFAVPILKILIEEHDVVLVVTQPDQKVGRKQTIEKSPVKELAETNHLPLFQPEKIKTDYQKIMDLKPDIIVTAAYGQMLPKALLEATTAINVHGSLLPKYRGGAPIQYALFNGDQTTGVTIMHMALKMDAGDIILQKELSILPNENVATLTNRLSLLGRDALREALLLIEKKKAPRIPQDETNVTYAPIIKPSDELLSFAQSTTMILNRLRGLTPEPGAYAVIKEHQLKIYNAKKSDIINDNKQRPGTVLQIKKRLLVQTLDGVVELLEVQWPGKRKMTAQDFLNGQKVIAVGDVFESEEIK
ncbi:MAG: methionyl-tRNA formyltransferase [Acholeplasmataceae bacterium]|nr:methionyl-tRNA formyltransferase [Acholeplasmataceae bacterium]